MNSPILVKSHRGGRTLSPEWVMERYKQKLARQHRERKKGSKNRDAEKSVVVNLDNSAPWMSDPKSIDDLVWIALQINQRAEQWKVK